MVRLRVTEIVGHLEGSNLFVLEKGVEVWIYCLGVQPGRGKKDMRRRGKILKIAQGATAMDSRTTQVLRVLSEFEFFGSATKYDMSQQEVVSPVQEMTEHITFIIPFLVGGLETRK